MCKCGDLAGSSDLNHPVGQARGRIRATSLLVFVCRITKRIPTVSTALYICSCCGFVGALSQAALTSVIEGQTCRLCQQLPGAKHLFLVKLSHAPLLTKRYPTSHQVHRSRLLVFIAADHTPYTNLIRRLWTLPVTALFCTAYLTDRKTPPRLSSQPRNLSNHPSLAQGSTRLTTEASTGAP